ncbi:protein of unknown function [Georgfuchsia toluolica]|uniref:Uncharacterized protein n=1 Tax=Georgfuchsia toluolica TaxID=424218 RepID=A0A916J2P7_9PROT|nr:protein of unknown function [Georgfuchsia toluolica]
MFAFSCHPVALIFDTRGLMKGQQKSPRLAGFQDFVGLSRILFFWSPRRESNLDLALRRHSFYPLNYEERARL